MDCRLDRQAAVVVFCASLPRRGAKGRNDRLFLEALHHRLANAAEALRQMERRVEAFQRLANNIARIGAPTQVAWMVVVYKMRKKYVFMGSAPLAIFQSLV